MKEKYERRISKLNKYFKGDLIMSPSKGLTPSNDYLERKLAQSPISKTSMDTKRNTHLTPMAKKSIMSSKLDLKSGNHNDFSTATNRMFS